MGRQILLKGVGMSFMGWFLFFIAALSMILFVPFTLRIKLHNVRDDITTVFILKFLLFRRLSLFTLHRTLKKNMEDVEDDILRMWLKKLFLSEHGLPRGKQIRRLSGYLFSLSSALDWHEMMVLIKIGTGDAASTGINIGLLRSLGGLFSNILRKKWRFREKDPLVLVYPYFLERNFKFYITAEFSAGLARLLYRVLLPSQNNKEVTRRWQKNIPFRP
jgi:hypothetical protein